jgi:hypothetical protein
MQQRNLRLGDSLCKMLLLHRTLHEYMEAECEQVDPDPHERSAGLLTLLSCEMILRSDEQEANEQEGCGRGEGAYCNTYCPPTLPQEWAHVSAVEDDFTELALARHATDGID